MSDVKWIKIEINLFENRKIKRILRLKNGDSFVLLWIRFLTLAGFSNNGGALMFTTKEPYTADTLAEVCDKSKAFIQKGLELFSEYDMIRIEDGIIVIKGWSEYQNTEGLDKVREQARERMRRSRERKKESEQSATVTQQLRNSYATDKEEEIEEELEIDKESESDIYHSSSSPSFPSSPPSPEIRELEEEFARTPVSDYKKRFDIMNRIHHLREAQYG